VTWKPEPTVTINGTDYTGFAVGRVSVQRGRRTVYETPNAGYCSVELLDAGGLVQPEVGQTLSVSVEDSAGSAVTVFRGVLSDWDAATRVTGGEPLVGYRVQAVGPLARLNRRQILTGGRPSEDDGERVLAALGGLSISWEEAGFDVSWQDFEGTWQDTGGFDPALVDPGVYTLAALGTSDGGYNALQVAQDAGFSGQGILYETASGMIAYADADRRFLNEQAGFLQVPAADLSVEGLRVSQRLADITNRVTVEFDGGAVTADDPFSIVRFGLFESDIRTSLVDAGNAQARADEFVSRHAVAQDVLEELPVNLLSVGTALRDALLDVEVNAAVQVTDIPARLGFTDFRGFVEGIRLDVDPFRADLTLTVSDRSLSVGSLRWGQVGGTVTWASVGTAVTWADTRVVFYA
jgi:hypothetical protein